MDGASVPYAKFFKPGSIFTAPSTATFSPFLANNLPTKARAEYGTPWSSTDATHQSLLTKCRDDLKAAMHADPDTIEADFLAHRLRRMDRNQAGDKAHLEGNDMTSYLQDISRTNVSRAREVTQGEYGPSSRYNIGPSAEWLRDFSEGLTEEEQAAMKEMSEEEINELRAALSFDGTLLDGQAAPFGKRVLMMQPFPNFNGAHGAPSTRDILFANIAGDLPFLEDAVGSLERDGVSAVILQYSQGSRYMEDVEYCDGAPGTAGEIKTWTRDHEIFKQDADPDSEGLSYDDWRIREVPVGERSILHMHYLRWENGSAPSEQGAKELQWLNTQLADATSILNRPKDMSKADAESALEAGRLGQGPLIMCHCLAGKGRAGSEAIQDLNESFFAHTASQILRGTPYGRETMRRFGTDTGEVFTGPYVNWGLDNNLLVATDDRKPMTPQDPEYPDSLPPIDHKAISDVSRKLMAHHADVISARRPVVEHLPQYVANCKAIEQRRKRYAEMVRPIVRDFVATLGSSDQVSNEMSSLGS